MRRTPTNPPGGTHTELGSVDANTTPIPLATPRAAPPPQRSRWRGHTGLRPLLYVAGVLLAAGMVLLASIPTNSNSDSRSDSTRSSTNGRDTSDESRDRSAAGLDNPGQLLDQPMPVPGQRWQGWDRYSNGRCAWLPQGLLDPLGPTGPPRPTSINCVVPLDDGTTVHIGWRDPAKRLLWYTGSVSNAGEFRGDPITVAGLEARKTKPFLLTVLFSGLCRVDVNTRSLAGLSIVVWGPSSSGDACRTAEKTAELVVRARVPVAGGAPWGDTPQQPVLLALLGRGPCELLAAGVSEFDELADGRLAVGSADTPAQCDLTDDTTRVQVWLTAGSEGHDDSDSDSDESTARRLGPLAAWQKDTAGTCTITTEILPGYRLGVSYHDSSYQDWASAPLRCAISEVIAANAVQTIFNHSMP